MNPKILCVDDEPHILDAYKRSLYKQFDLDTAVGGEQGLIILQAKGPYAVVVADMQMPNLNGIQFLREVEQKAPESIRVMLTGNADQKTAMLAINQGHIFRFLSKPCDPEVMAMALNAAVKQYQLVISERELLEKTLKGSVKLLTEIMAVIDAASFQYSEALVKHVNALATLFNIKNTWELEISAMLSQIGNVTLPPIILTKLRSGQALSNKESDLLERVPEIGSKLLNNIPRLESISKIILYQHKNFDGSGFPKDSCAGESIPLESRIIKVVIDLFHMEAFGLKRTVALDNMYQRRGTYDPMVLQMASSYFTSLLNITNPIKEGKLTILTKDLKVGQVLAEDVFTSDQFSITRAGSVVTKSMLEKITNFSETYGVIEPLYVYDK